MDKELKELDKILDYFGEAQIEMMTLSKCNILTIKQALIKAQSQEKEYVLLANLIYNLVSTALINFRVRTLRSGITDYSIFDAEEYQHIQIDKETFEAVKKVMEDFDYEEEIGIQ